MRTKREKTSADLVDLIAEAGLPVPIDMLMCEQLTEVNGQLVSRINVNAMIREVTRRMHIIAELLRDPEIFPLPETASREGVDTFKQQLCDFAESVAAFNKREMPTAIMAFADRAPARGQHDRG